jgi:hypothetical protein
VFFNPLSIHLNEHGYLKFYMFINIQSFTSILIAVFEKLVTKIISKLSALLCDNLTTHTQLLLNKEQL